MTRRVLVLLVVGFFAGVLGALIARDPGYVLVVWEDASLETSVWFALALVVATWLLLHALWTLLGLLAGSRGQLLAWRRARRERRGREGLPRGLLALSEGNWAGARKLLATDAAAPLASHLGAARAAHGMGDLRARDDCLAEALRVHPEGGLAVGLTQAELAMADGQWEHAHVALTDLRRDAPRNPHLLDLLRTVLERLEDWRGLADLLPELKKAGRIDGPERDALERRLWLVELRRAGSGCIDAEDEDRRRALEEAWGRVPKALRSDPELVLAKALALVELAAEPAAEALLRGALAHNWDARLVSLYGRIEGADARTQYGQAKTWLAERPDDGALLLAVGRLALRTEQWDTARECLEASLDALPGAEAHAELGRLLASQGEHVLASEHFDAAIREQGEMLCDVPVSAAGHAGK